VVWLVRLSESNGGADRLGPISRDQPVRETKSSSPSAPTGRSGHDYLESAGSWSGWGTLSGPSGVGIVSDITVGYNNQGSEELFARTADGSVWHNFYEGAGVWSGWYDFGGPTGVQIVSDLSVGSTSTGTKSSSPSAPTGSVWHDYLESAGSWSGWGTLSGPSGVGIVSDITVGL